jgi:V/A-type H+-transporting ATPase subunit C
VSGFHSDYLETRLGLFAARLIGTRKLISFIDLEPERLLAEVNRLSAQDYTLDGANSQSVEAQLTGSALADFQVLLRPFSGSERRFFYFAIRWFELVNLKVLIRGKFSGIDNAVIRQHLVDIGGFADLPIGKLLEADDPYEMLRLLETTAYAGIVRHSRRVYEEQGNDLFLLDATIDRSFFIGLYQRLDYLRKQDGAALRKVLGSLLDRFNLIWLLRYRFSYGLSAAKSFYLLSAIGKRLHSTELMQLARLDNIEEVIAELPEPYQALLANLRQIPDMEAAMEFYALSIAAQTLRRGDNLVARVFSYILLREAELRFLQALIKGKQLGLDDELIKRGLGAAA